MSRAARLLELTQALRRRRAPATGRSLADELGVSLRTVYRDIDALRAQGAQIEGEAGVGFVLRPGFLLPPLMFSSDEIDAVALGLRYVGEQSDQTLSAAARNALAKIAAVLPQGRDEALIDGPLMVPPRPDRGEGAALALLRDAIRGEAKVRIAYRDGGDHETLRVVWPIAIAFFEQALVLAAWCELRSAFRHFRLDRVSSAEMSGDRYPERRRALARRWRASLEPAADGN